MIHIPEHTKKPIDLTNSIDERDKSFLKTRFNIKRLGFSELNNRLYVSNTSHVGKIPLPSGQVLNFQSKVRIKNVFNLLAYTYEIPLSYNDFLRKYQTVKWPSLIELYGTIFVIWVTRLTKGGLNKVYIQKQLVSNKIKGRIKKVNYGISTNDLKIEIEFQSLSQNTPENKLIKRVILDLMNSPQISRRLAVRLKNLLSYFKNVESINKRRSDLLVLSYKQPNRLYAKVIELSKLILGHQFIIDEPGKAMFSGYLINMNYVFEKFFQSVLQRHLRDQNLAFNQVMANPMVFESGLKYENKPDIRINKNVVIDIKYKKPNKNKPYRDDLRQIKDYSDYLEGPKVFALLVYAGNKQVIFDQTAGDINTAKRIGFFIFPLNIHHKHFKSRVDEFVEMIRVFCEFQNHEFEL